MKKHFTLMELLLVICVIAILLSILMPALKTAMDTAKGIECKGKVKQIHLNFQYYLNDYNGFLPCVIDPVAPIYPIENQWATWIQRIYPEEFAVQTSIPATMTFNLRKQLRCPWLTEKLPDWLLSSVSATSYWMNYNGIGGTKNAEKTEAVKIMNIRHPAKQAAFGDVKYTYRYLGYFQNHGDRFLSPDSFADPEYSNTLNGNPTGITMFRHKGKANIIFVDGHVESLGTEIYIPAQRSVIFGNP